jgi:hypothetical protein
MFNDRCQISLLITLYNFAMLFLVKVPRQVYKRFGWRVVGLSEKKETIGFLGKMNLHWT